MVFGRYNGSYWCIGFAALLAGSPLYAQPVNDNARGQASSANSNSSVDENPGIASDLGRIASALETQNNNQNSAAENQRADDDLKAQKDMAKWAMWMFYTALAQAIFTAISIILIYITFREARRAADSGDKMAREATKATAAAAEATAAAIDAVKVGQEANELAVNNASQQLMPYVYIDKIQPFDFMSPVDYIQVVLKNYGQTPATNVVVKGVYLRCKIGKGVLGKVELNRRWTSRDIAPQGTRTININLGLEEQLLGTVRQILAGNIMIVVNLRYSYKGLETKTLFRQDIIILDKNGFREPSPADNIKNQK